MPRHPRLALAQDGAEIAHGQVSLRTERQQPQPAILGHGPQAGEKPGKSIRWGVENAHAQALPVGVEGESI